eukprot:4530322-Prymnesium_polylepis.1
MVVDELNDRFARGHPTDDWQSAGVLIHAFDAVDGYNGHDDLWNGCQHSSTWCFQLNRFSASMINARKPHYFNQFHSRMTGEPKGGFIISTAVVGPQGIRCMMPFDAGTVGDSSGCPGTVCPGNGGWCHWPGNQLRQMLEVCAKWPAPIIRLPNAHHTHLCTAHVKEARDSRNDKCGQAVCDYDEIIIDSDFWRVHLPHTILAVFFPIGGSEAAQMARRVHTAFLEHYPERASATPLLSYGYGQFRLVR